MTIRGMICGATGLGLLLCAALPALAQTQAASGSTVTDAPNAGIELGGGKYVDPATKEKRREIERAYKEATQKIPAQQTGPNDPWANMRGADEAKPAAKPKLKPPAHTAKKKTQ
jgi:hypothetical protein